MTVELTEPEDLPELTVSVNVPEEEYPDSDETEITVEATLDNDVVVILAWPHNGELVDRGVVHQTLALFGQSIDQILDAMEATSE